MKAEELAGKLSEIQLKFDSLRDNMAIFQQNINNNITWFYMVVTIIVAILLPALYFLVKSAVSMGVEKGIEKAHKKIEDQIKESKQFHIAKGNTNIIDNKIHIAGLSDFSKENIVSVTVVTKHGQILESINVIIHENGYLTIETHDVTNFLYAHWTIVWIPTSNDKSK
jgi:hypothetical protein